MIEKALQLLASRSTNLAEALHRLGVVLITVQRQVVGALAFELQVDALQEIREPVPDDVEVPRVKFFLLHQHLLAHADFSEVVQQARVAQLAQLLLGELHVAILAGAAAIHCFRERHRERRDATRMTGGGGVS